MEFGDALSEQLRNLQEAQSSREAAEIEERDQTRAVCQRAHALAGEFAREVISETAPGQAGLPHVVRETASEWLDIGVSNDEGAKLLSRIVANTTYQHDTMRNVIESSGVLNYVALQTKAVYRDVEAPLPGCAYAEGVILPLGTGSKVSLDSATEMLGLFESAAVNNLG